MERRIFPPGKDDHPRKPCSYEDLRWSRFKHFAPKEMFTVVSEHLFPFLRTLGGDGSTYAHHMKDRDTKGELYEYMLGKIATAGQNGQFRTPRRIIQLMVELTAPQPGDVICDPACGTASKILTFAPATHWPKTTPARKRNTRWFLPIPPSPESLCYHLGYEVGRYISRERLIEQNKERYYETFEPVWIRAGLRWQLRGRD